MSEYAELISSTCRSFSIEDDIGALSRIHESLQASRATRSTRRQESRAFLLDLSRTLEAASHAIRVTRDAAPGDHDGTMNALDREKFALAKNMNDLETQTHTLESQLRRHVEDYERMGEDVSAAENAFDHDEATVLKLSVYRDLGIQLTEDQGVYGQAIVRSADGRDVHMVALDKTGASYADHLWDLCSH